MINGKLGFRGCSSNAWEETRDQGGDLVCGVEIICRHEVSSGSLLFDRLWFLGANSNRDRSRVRLTDDQTRVAEQDMGRGQHNFESFPSGAGSMFRGFQVHYSGIKAQAVRLGLFREASASFTRLLYFKCVLRESAMLPSRSMFLDWMHTLVLSEGFSVFPPPLSVR